MQLTDASVNGRRFLSSVYDESRPVRSSDVWGTWRVFLAIAQFSVFENTYFGVFFQILKNVTFYVFLKNNASKSR